MLTFRRAEGRGRALLGWLTSHHAFSFGDGYHAAHMGFGALRVLNDHRVQPSTGLPRHPHRDLEIFTHVLEGVLAREDSMGSGSTVRAGEVQRVSAGTGVTHREMNPSEKAGPPSADLDRAGAGPRPLLRAEGLTEGRAARPAAPARLALRRAGLLDRPPGRRRPGRPLRARGGLAPCHRARSARLRAPREGRAPGERGAPAGGRRRGGGARGGERARGGRRGPRRGALLRPRLKGRAARPSNGRSARPPRRAARSAAASRGDPRRPGRRCAPRCRPPPRPPPPGRRPARPPRAGAGGTRSRPSPA